MPTPFFRRSLALAITVALAISLVPATSASAAASTTCTSKSQATLQKQLFAELNAARKRVGKGPMLASPSLDKMAVAWSEKMAKAKHLSHNPSLRSQLPAGWRSYGENVAYGYTAQKVTRAWLDSPGHRQNMLGNFNRAGFGVACASNGQPYYTQVFGLYPAKKLTSVTAKVLGTRKVGATLTAAHGTWTAGTSFSYQWYRNGKAVKAATKKTYVPKKSDRGAQFSVKITGKKYGYAASSRTSVRTAKIR